MIPLQKIDDSVTKEFGINLYVLRLDLNHANIGGNKLYKLKYNIAEAKKQEKNTILTFGGAFSNHIAATAFAGKENGIKTIGIIRGDESTALNPTLKFAKENGMEIKLISRELYKNKNTKDFLKNISEEFNNPYVIPEGGGNELGIKGCEEILSEISTNFDKVYCACGTGTTIVGIISSLKNNQEAIGVQVLKGENYIQSEVQQWLDKLAIKNKNWKITESFHFGGYAKYNNELISFIKQFEQENKIPLDYIYTGKMMFGIYSLIKDNSIKKNDTIIAIHTGGIQGNKGFEQIHGI